MKRESIVLSPKVPGFVYKGDSTEPRGHHREDGGEAVASLGLWWRILSISHVRFEIVPEAKLVEGSVVFCIHNGSKVFYQVRMRRPLRRSFCRIPMALRL